MLAESHTVSKDGLTYTFKLRQGIKFHNGKEMTSEDVVPSLARWGKQSIYGKARVAQVETGELEFADDLNLDAYERLKKNPNARTIISKPYYWLVAVFNKKEGLMTNAKLRQAWQAAIDIEPIMKNVAGGHAEFYRMDSSLAPVEIAAWHTKLAGLPWNEHNREKARRLLKEAGYKSEPIRFMTTQEYKWMYDFALLTKQQLEDVGFTIDLQVVDWATLVKRRNNPKEYDAFTTGIGAAYDPTHHVYLTVSWPGWTTDEDIVRLQAELARETDPKKRMALWEMQTRQFYEKVPVIRYGDLFGLRAMRTSMKGFNEKTERIRFYNVWLDK